MGGFIDVHCHLTGDEYAAVGGVEETVKRAIDEGVTTLICSGFDIPSSEAAARLADKFPQVYFCAGYHPSELKKYADGDLERLKELCQADKCVAVGEIGLDYHFEDNPPREMQKEFFIRQLTLAAELNLPVVVHSRDAAQDTLQLLTENQTLLKRGGLMHCYSYSAEMVKPFADLGLYFSFGGPCTFKNAKKTVESVAAVSQDRLLTETDCPYLTPEPYRGTFPNQPKNIPFVLRRLAAIREVDEQTLQTAVLDNAQKLFFKLAR